MKCRKKIAILKRFLYNNLVLCKHLKLFGGYNVRQHLKRFGKKAISLLLAALLCATASASALGAEGDDLLLSEEHIASSVDGTSSLTEDLSEEGSDFAEAPAESDAASSEEIPGEDAAEDGSEEALPESDLMENDVTTFAAESLLVTGGHETYMSGYAGALFMPGNAMTRAEVAMMLYQLLKSKPTVTQSQFSDVPLSAWYGQAVNALASVQVLSGYKDGTFLPKNTISRAEFVTALSRCFPLLEGKAEFTDVPETHWAYKFIASATTAGWINGVGNGKFQPERGIMRCEAVTAMNIALGRTGDGFAADRDTQKFKDVPKTHWAYLQITEAANPVDAPVVTDPQPSGNYQVGQSVRVTADSGLNLRSQPNTSSSIVTTLPFGTVVTITDISPLPWLGVKTANGTAGYVLSDYVEPYGGSDPSGEPAGASLSASTLSLHQYQTARLDASVTSGMDRMSWTSSDPSVAVVGYTVSYSKTKHGAMVYGKKAGTATLTFSDASGKTKATCTVTVTAPEAVRYAYASENAAVKGQPFDLVAVTDTSRSSMTFTIISGPASGSYSTTNYTTETRASSYGLPTNSVRVFKRSVTFSAAGTYTVRASANSGSSLNFTVFVRNSADSETATVSGERRATTKGLCLIANFEGYVPEVEDDVIASGNPTVGYGYVVPVNTSFYNNLTKSEAFAMLVDKANNGGYTAGVNRFLSNNSVKMSQAQFDALLSFVWNCGTGPLDISKYDTPKVMVNAVVPPSDLSEARPYNGTLNVGASPIYRESSLSSSVLTTVKSGETVSVIGWGMVEAKHQAWYKVKYGSHTGWMPAGKVNLSATGLTRDLAYADAGTLSTNFLEWHKSGNTHIYGLLTRRMAECKVFFFGNYAEAFHSYVDLGTGMQYSPSPNYTKNTYSFVFPDCCKQYE